MPRNPVLTFRLPEPVFDALVREQLYLQFSKPLSAERGVDEGQAARSCRCMEVTP